MQHTRSSMLGALTLAALTSFGMFNATAQTSPPQAPIASTPNPAAEQAVRAHTQNILAAINGQSAAPSAQQFTDDFNAQVQPDQLTAVLNNVRANAGNCQVAAQIRSPVSHVAGYLLNCDKAFVPVELVVEEQAPYRIQGLLIRPSFWKL